MNVIENVVLVTAAVNARSLSIVASSTALSVVATDQYRTNNLKSCHLRVANRRSADIGHEMMIVCLRLHVPSAASYRAELAVVRQ